MILKDLRNEIKITIKQLMDDHVVTDLQIDYWIKCAADALRWKALAAQGLEDQRRSGRYLRRFVVDIQTDNVSADRSCLKFVTLPGQIYDYELDLGVDAMSYYASGECDGCPPPFTKITFARTTPAASRSLYMSEDQKPSAWQPYFFREGNNLFLLGLDQSPSITKVEIRLFTTLPDIRTIDPDADVDIADELLLELRRLVLENARLMLMLNVSDRTNDGNGDTSGDSLPKQVSVNEQQVSEAQ